MSEKIKEWNIWDFPDTLYVKFSDELRIRLFRQLIEKFGSRNRAAMALGCHTVNLRTYLQWGHDSEGFQAFMPLKYVKKLPELLGDSIKEEIQGNIAAYRARAGNPVRNPILPIKESPELYSLIAHLICDGSAGKGKTPYYANTRMELLEELKESLKVFGEFDVTTYRMHSNVYAVMFPKAISDILSYVFGVPFVRTERLPKLLFEAPKKCQLAALRAMFDDEGSIHESGQITIVNKPRGVIEDTKRLLKQNDIETGVVTFTKDIHALSVLSRYREIYLRDIGFVHKIKKNKAAKVAQRDKKLKEHVKLEDRIYNLLNEKQPLSRFEIAGLLSANLNSVTDALYKGLRAKGKITSRFNGKNRPYLWSKASSSGQCNKYNPPHYQQ